MGTVGRQRELAEIGADVYAGRHVAVVGPMGVGKSHLVRAVLRRAGAHALVATGLRLGADRDGLTLATALGEPPPLGCAAAAARWCAERLAGRRLVVENLQWVDGRSLTVLLELGAGIPLILTARDAAELSDPAARLLAACRLHPLGPLGATAGRTLARAHGTCPDVDPIVDASAGRPLLVRELAAGAGGSELLRALAPVLDHDLRPVPAAVERTLTGMQAPGPVHTPAGGTASLTGREREVLAEVRTGATTTQIAHRLGVAPSTAETHIRSAMRKLGARTRCQAALAAEAWAVAHA